MTEIFHVNSDIEQKAHISRKLYDEMYKESVENPEKFWANASDIVSWYKKPTKISDANFSENDLHIKWFEDGTLNVCYNCVDRHLNKHGNKIAYYFESDDGSKSKSITYNDLYKSVVEVALKLKAVGVKKGDIVVIYMPMTLDAIYTMLACARIGAVISVVFAGFSPNALKDRILDTKAKYIITSDVSHRAGKKVQLKASVDEAIKDTQIEKVLVFKNSEVEIKLGSKDILMESIQVDSNANCDPEHMNAEDQLFILYTSGSTNKPKGIVHTTGGYLVYAAMTHKYIFDYKHEDVYWSTADIGWITGHSYVVYGPLTNAATSVVFEGVPSYPDYSRIWQIVDKYKVSILYTAPTLVRSLMKEGDDFVKKTSRNTLRVLGSVGEPINPEAWLWLYKVAGNSRCPIVDTWWQTETGGILITPLIGARDLKPGSATKPFFGVEPVLFDNEGKEVIGSGEGNLCIKNSWPGQARTILGDHNRFYTTYFASFKNTYFSGDGAKRDADGYYWITGRVDDVINVSGHRIGTAEVESAFITHAKVAESAVVGYPHEIKGQGIFCYVVLKQGFEADENLGNQLKAWVRKILGAIITPDIILICADLPKTRSGKIMRRILRKIAEGEYSQIGDTSTLADPKVVEGIIEMHKRLSLIK
ncbi:MAG: acetate--CoA ligase [Alphaproteobacteria bacterium]|nr:acetate--CoA ligase [Alphaproteobacteria bacterium]OJV12244.1 MAG: acetate--CoA ligase [Alphaproteobacteria bacterium 33-17]